MKAFQTFILLFILPSMLIGQLNQQWKKQIVNHHENQRITFSDMANHQLIYNIAWNEIVNDETERYNHSYLSDDDGALIWDFDWNNHFVGDYALRFTYNEQNGKLLFTVDYKDRDSLNYIGVFGIQSGIEWQEPVQWELGGQNNQWELGGQNNLGEDFVFVARSGDSTRLVNISATGIRNWETDILALESNRGYLEGNQNDLLLWLVDNDLHLVNQFGEIIGIDSSRNWSPYYSIVHVHQDIVDVFGWGLPYYVQRFNNNLQETLYDSLPYTNNSFLRPTAYVNSDSAGHLFVSATDLFSSTVVFPFVRKYDNDLKELWTHEAAGTVINMHNNEESLVYVTANSIALLNAKTGSLFDQKSLIDQEHLNVESQYTSIANFEKDSYYTFTTQDSSFYLTKYEVKSTTVGIDKTDLSNIKIFPNPTSEILNIENNAFQHVRVFDLMGRVSIEGKNVGKKLNVSMLDSGMYTIAFYDDKQNLVYSQLFVKI